MRKGEDPMNEIRVVIAEDHALMREGTRHILEQHERLRVVGEAANGREAVELVRRLCPDVAILDIAMPEMNGIDATREIKETNPSTGILVLTAYDDDQYVFALLDAGAAGYLLKDIRGTELASAVVRVHTGEAVLHPVVARKVLNRFVRSEDASRPPLSERELEVLQLAARGLSNKEIGRSLGLSARTVQVHLAHVFDKLNVASRTEAVIHGLREGWISLDAVS